MSAGDRLELKTFSRVKLMAIVEEATWKNEWKRKEKLRQSINSSRLGEETCPVICVHAAVHLSGPKQVREPSPSSGIAVGVQSRHSCYSVISGASTSVLLLAIVLESRVKVHQGNQLTHRHRLLI